MSKEKKKDEALEAASIFVVETPPSEKFQIDMMDNNRKRKKNKKAYYCSKKKAKRQCRLGEGMKGFMLTCNNKEKQCIAEAYNLLNEFAEILYGPEQQDSKESSDSEEDVAKELEKELEGMKSVKVNERRFQAVDTHANNCLFIKTQLNNPGELMESILLDMERCKNQKTRFLLRMIPVLQTCKAYADVITKQASVFLENFNDEIAKHKSFAVNFKARNNASIGRLEVINTFAALIHAKNPAIKADLKNPEVVVNVDIIGQICCLSILPNYYRFKKYNLSEVALGSNNVKGQQEKDTIEAKSNNPEIPEKESELTGNGETTPVVDVAKGTTSANKLDSVCNTDSNVRESKMTGNGEATPVVDDAKVTSMQELDSVCNTNSNMKADQVDVTEERK